MKKILISLGMIGVVAAIAIGGTMALFTDTETSTGNTFTAGTLDLTYTVNGGVEQNNTNDQVTYTLLVPGSTGSDNWNLTNAGSIDASALVVTAVISTDADNTLEEPEAGVDPDDLASGELDDYMMIVLGINTDADPIWVDANNDGIVDTDELDTHDTVLYQGLLSGIAGPYALGALTATSNVTMTIDFSIGTGVGNVIQSDSAVVDLTFDLTQ